MELNWNIYIYNGIYGIEYIYIYPDSTNPSARYWNRYRQYRMHIGRPIADVGLISACTSARYRLPILPDILPNHICTLINAN